MEIKEAIIQKLQGILERLGKDRMIDVVYSATRYLSHLNIANVLPGGLRYPQEFVEKMYAGSDANGRVVAEVIRMIETQEGSPVQEMPGERARQYSRLLTDLMFQIMAKERPFNAERGKRLLQQLRAT